MTYSQAPYPKRKVQVSTIAVIVTDGIRGVGSVTIDKLLLLPQTMLVSNKRFCNVIQVSYELVVEAEVSGCHGGIEISIPITVGLEPSGAKELDSNNNISSLMDPLPAASLNGLRELSDLNFLIKL